jgi:hypothetical protein
MAFIWIGRFTAAAKRAKRRRILAKRAFSPDPQNVSSQTLSAVSRSLNVSRATLRNWRSRTPALNEAFTVFEQNKAKKAAHQLHVRRYKQVASEIVDAAREGSPDPVETEVKAHTKAEQVESRLNH